MEPQKKMTRATNNKNDYKHDKPTIIGLVASKYQNAGWCVFRQTNTINDIIAHCDKKLHFIKVVPENAAKPELYEGIAQNEFIQNAFSNSAIPVYAYVADLKIGLMNINTQSRLIIDAKKPPTKTKNITASYS